MKFASTGHSSSPPTPHPPHLQLLLAHHINVEDLLSKVDNHRQLPMDPIVVRARKELEALEASSPPPSKPSDIREETSSPVQEIMLNRNQNPPSEMSFWVTEKPQNNAKSKPKLPRPVPPNISANKYQKPHLPEKQRRKGEVIDTIENRKRRKRLTNCHLTLLPPPIPCSVRRRCSFRCRIRPRQGAFSAPEDGPRRFPQPKT